MITSKQRIVAPTGPVVTLDEMREHLRLDTEGSPPVHPEDALIQSYVGAVTSELDAGEGWLGRALHPQTWRITLDRFPCVTRDNPSGAILLPYPPLLEVESVTYVDDNGATQSFTDYTVNSNAEPAELHPAFNASWPSTRNVWNAVTIQFRCGYDVDASPTNPVPELIRQYVRIVAASMYEQREADAINVRVQPIDQFRNAIRQFRVWGPA